MSKQALNVAHLAILAARRASDYSSRIVVSLPSPRTAVVLVGGK